MKNAYRASAHSLILTHPYIFVSFKTLPILCRHSIYCAFCIVFSLYNSNSFEHNKDVGMGKYERVSTGTVSKDVGMGL